MYDPIETTKEEWRELGFYYDFDKENHEWHLTGSCDGLSGLVSSLNEFTTNERNAALGEHEHLGPYMYLTIVTSDKPQFTAYGIFGSFSDLQRLANIVGELILKATPNDKLRIDSEYSAENEASLVFEFKEDGFDPSDADSFEWAKK